MNDPKNSWAGSSSASLMRILRTIGENAEATTSAAHDRRRRGADIGEDSWRTPDVFAE